MRVMIARVCLQPLDPVEDQRLPVMQLCQPILAAIHEARSTCQHITAHIYALTTMRPSDLPLEFNAMSERHVFRKAAVTEFPKARYTLQMRRLIPETRDDIKLDVSQACEGGVRTRLKELKSKCRNGSSRRGDSDNLQIYHKATQRVSRTTLHSGASPGSRLLNI